MKNEFISYPELPSYPSIVTDYLNQNSSLRSYYQAPPTLLSFEKQIMNRNFSDANRKTLHSALIKQYEGTERSELLDINIQSLLQESTFTVTTGHQTNFCTGPLYFIYKIASVIKLSQELNRKYVKNHFVPIYWMHTEDHDFEEVNHIYYGDKKYVWEDSQGGSCGGFSLKQAFILWQEIRVHAETLRSRSSAEEEMDHNEFLEIFTHAYSRSKNLAEATKSIVHKLFGKYGLVVLDPNVNTLKTLFTPVVEQELTAKHSFRIQSESIEQLGKEYKVQVNPRDINLFLVETGMRERIIQEGNIFKINNTQREYSLAELLEMLNHHPEKFSPNVILRSLYQETILPNVSYTGGTAEIAYWLSFKKLFDHYKIPFPILMVRDSFLYVDKNAENTLQKVNLPLHSILADAEAARLSFIKSKDFDGISIDEEKKNILQEIEVIKEKLSQLDVNFARTVEGEKQKLLKSFGLFESKIVKAKKRLYEEDLKRFDKLITHLFPNGTFQERHQNLLWLWDQEGNGTIDYIIEKCTPFEFGLKIIGKSREEK